MMNVMIAYVNSAAERWVDWIAAASLGAAVLFALACLVWLAIRNRVAPQVGYCLFLLVPLKLLVPVVVTVPTGVARWTPSVCVGSWFKIPRVPERTESRPPFETRVNLAGQGRSARSEPGLASVSQEQPVAPGSHQEPLPNSPRSRRPIGQVPVADSVTGAPGLSLSARVMIAWLAGVVLLLGRHGARRRISLEGALGVFGLDARAGCFLRVRRLLDTERPVRTAPGVWWLGGFPAGETAHIELGASGRAVVGKLQPPEGWHEKVRWNLALVTVTAEAARGRPVGPVRTATVDLDGAFRIDDVPAGNYSLSVRFSWGQPGHLWNHRFIVPSLEGDRAIQPVDLGTLSLEPPGQVAGENVQRPVEARKAFLPTPSH
jgi:hypothetical protein